MTQKKETEYSVLKPVRPIPRSGSKILEPVQLVPGPVPKFLDPLQPGPRPVPYNLTGYPVPLIPTITPILAMLVGSNDSTVLTSASENKMGYVLLQEHNVVPYILL